MVAGVVQYYMKTPIYAVETSCVVQKGVQECVIVAGGRETILGYMQKFSPDRVDYTKETLDRIQEVEKELKGNKVLDKVI